MALYTSDANEWINKTKSNGSTPYADPHQFDDSIYAWGGTPSPPAKPKTKVERLPYYPNGRGVHVPVVPIDKDISDPTKKDIEELPCRTLPYFPNGDPPTWDIYRKPVAKRPSKEEPTEEKPWYLRDDVVTKEPDNSTEDQPEKSALETGSWLGSWFG